MAQKEKLQLLIEKFMIAKKEGKLKNSSEETIRTWINELLGIFGWNVQDTQQVIQEQTLSPQARKKLKNIGSNNIRPDYTLVNGKVKLIFVDAKNLYVDIYHDKDTAFQIRSYGWSIGAKFSIVTNFESMAVYDCTNTPSINDSADYARLYYFVISDYISNFELLQSFLDRQRILEKAFTVSRHTGKSIDSEFTTMLSAFRISLATAILAQNKGINLHQLSLFVQIIINRILFVRVCEAKSLEENGLLLKFSQNGFWDNFKQCSYIDFYEHYDGPMFKRINELQSLQIDNEVFHGFLSKLYYPSPYRFDVIPLKSLSDIYDLFLGYRMTFDKGKIKDELRPEFRKSNGAVTTPLHIVEKVIECTMPHDQLNKMTIEEILKLRILDPACGSGVFLAAIYDYISEVLLEKIRQSSLTWKDKIVRYKNDIILTLQFKKEVLNNCLYGIDINPEAVEVARMSLSLKVIDDCPPSEFEAIGLLGSKILEEIGTHIQCGNTLVEPNIMDLFPEIQDSLEELQTTNAFLPKSAFADIFRHGGFDYVIGNPPYVEVKHYNMETPTMASYIKKVYSSSRNGKIDLSIPFVERGIQLLNEHGRLGYIIQKRFFRTEYGKGIRKFLSEKKLLNSIYDYTQTDLFIGKITYVAVLVCDKNAENNSRVTYINSDNQVRTMLASNLFSANPWLLKNLRVNKIRMNLGTRLGTLRDVCHVKVGLQMLWDAAYHIYADRVTEKLIKGHTTIDPDVTIEKEACRILLCNENFSPLTLQTQKTFALFPYEIDGNNNVHELSMTEFTQRYPLAAAYLRLHRQEIEQHVQTLPKRNFSYDKDEYWHLYTRANNLNATYPKICIPMTAQYPQAAVVMERNVYCDNANMFFLQMSNLTPCKLYAMAAIINSTIFSTLARSMANPQQGGYFKFNKQFLDPVPVPVMDIQQENKDIKELARLALRIEQLNLRIKKEPKRSGLCHALVSAWKNVDTICDRLYGITENEHNELYKDQRNDRIYE